MGRQLESMTDANNSIQYKYNSDGIRTQKTVNGAARNYRLLGDKVTMEQTGSQTPIYYAYDSAGKLFLICCLKSFVIPCFYHDMVLAFIIPHALNFMRIFMLSLEKLG